MRLLCIWLFYMLVATPMCFCLQTNSSVSASLTSSLRTPVERVFSRRKRWLVFPKGSAMKFTMSISKRLLAKFPRGFNFNIEAAVYYPMPTTRLELIPKIFRKPTTKAPKMKGPTPLNLIGIPGSLIKYRFKPATRAPVVQRVDLNSSALQWVSSPPSAFTSNNLHYYNPQKWSKYSSPEYLKNYQWSPHKQHKYVDTYSNNKWSKWPPISAQHQPYNANSYKKWNSGPRYARNANNFDAFDDFQFEPLYFEDLEPFVESPHYHAYRGRRELFHHFEGLTKILGMDMKSCVLRAMCDSKRFLLPPGYSMLQDILRVIFTFPTINGLQDEYSRIMQADYQTCDSYIHHKCPLNILDWLLNSKKSL